MLSTCILLSHVKGIKTHWREEVLLKTNESWSLHRLNLIFCVSLCVFYSCSQRASLTWWRWWTRSAMPWTPCRKRTEAWRLVWKLICRELQSEDLVSKAALTVEEFCFGCIFVRYRHYTGLSSADYCFIWIRVAVHPELLPGSLVMWHE